MDRNRPFQLSLLVLLSALVLGAAACSAQARPPALFASSPHGPYRVGDQPVALMVGNFDVLGLGEYDYLVGYAKGSKANLFSVSPHRPLHLRRMAQLDAPGASSALGGQPGGEFAILSARSRHARVFVTNPFQNQKIEEGDTVGTGLDPVAALTGGFVYPALPKPLEGLDLAVVNRGSNDLWVFNGDYKGHMEPPTKIPLGPEPTAAVSEGCCGGLIYVTTAGDDRVTQLGNFQSGELPTRRSFPVGDRPSALTLGDFVTGDYGDNEIAVANRGSDDVTILDDPNRGWNFETVGTYPVGDEPMAITALNVDDRGGMDLAVANAGSNDVTILLGDGQGGFRPGGTYPVGRRPVAIAATHFDRLFEPDLVVVNRGSDDLTVLLRHEVGHCQGRVARLRLGTPGADQLRGRGGPDEIKALGGDDQIVDGAGGGCLLGEEGDDTILGGPKGDLIVGGPGEDSLNARTGADRLFVRDHERDEVDCGPGRDRVVADRIDRLHDCEVVIR
jgi:hypothetical protein